MDVPLLRPNISARGGFETGAPPASLGTGIVDMIFTPGAEIFGFGSP